MRKKSEAHPAHFTLGFPSFGCSWRPAAPRRYLAGAPDHQPGGDHDVLGRTLPAVQPGEEQPGRGPAERRRILSHDRDGRIEQSASWTSSKPTRAIRRWAPSRRRPRTAPMLIRFWAVNSAVGGHGEQLDHGLQRLVATPDIPPYESPVDRDSGGGEALQVATLALGRGPDGVQVAQEGDSARPSR